MVVRRRRWYRDVKYPLFYSNSQCDESSALSVATSDHKDANGNREQNDGMQKEEVSSASADIKVAPVPTVDADCVPDEIAGRADGDEVAGDSAKGSHKGTARSSSRKRFFSMSKSLSPRRSERVHVDGANEDASGCALLDQRQHPTGHGHQGNDGHQGCDNVSDIRPGCDNFGTASVQETGCVSGVGPVGGAGGAGDSLGGDSMHDSIPGSRRNSTTSFMYQFKFPKLGAGGAGKLLIENHRVTYA
jgi:hypothetical protein